MPDTQAAQPCPSQSLQPEMDVCVGTTAYIHSTCMPDGWDSYSPVRVSVSCCLLG